MDGSARPWAISARPRRRDITDNGESRSRAAWVFEERPAKSPPTASARRLWTSARTARPSARSADSRRDVSSNGLASLARAMTMRSIDPPLREGLADDRAAGEGIHPVVQLVV